jgi:electron transfer flavoprotein alpha subunit
MSKVLIVGEMRNGRLAASAGELAAAAGQLGGELEAAVLGSGSSAAAADFGRYGISQAHALDGDLPLYSGDGYASALASLVRSQGYDYVILMQSTLGRDLGARLAAELNGGWIDDITGIEVGAETLFVKPLYAGKVISRFRFKGSGPKVLTLRPKVFAALSAGEGSATVSAIAAPASYLSRVSSIEARAAGEVDLKDADIIVTGGRAVGGPAGFEPLKAFASSIGAALGASRAAVDAGWIGHKHQVGQTGKTVNPKLYIACGVSGAIQHLAGMQTSKVIVAINSNENAPIFKIADYGIVGDLFEIVPELEKQMKAAIASRN